MIAKRWSAAGPITVSTYGGVAPSPAFGVFSTSAPVISSFPATASVGFDFSISGQHFTGLDSISFNGTPAASFIVTSDSTVYTSVPAGATSGPISLTNSIGTTASTGSVTIQ